MAATKLKTLPVALVTAAIVALAASLILWQLGTSPTPAGTSSVSGVVSQAVPPLAAPIEITPSAGVASGMVTPMPAPPPAAASRAEEKPPAPARAPAAAVAQTKSQTPAPAAVKHPVSPQASRQPPILPNEVDAVLGQTFGRKTLARHLWLDPLARRFVASVDGLGNATAPTSLWLLRPAPGDFQLTQDRMAAANSKRYERFVNWVERSNTAALVDLYARMYPLLQETYVELGHPGGHFNDRVIEVIDLMLATPVRKTPLKVKPAPPKPSSLTPPKPRYEIADPKLEALSTGQKILLRLSPQQAATIKAKLKALRAGLVRLERERR